MSKAFTREDDAPELPLPARQASTLPPGAKNYLTPDGAERLRSEIARLQERRRTLASPDETEARRQLALLDTRVRQLEKSLNSATIVGPPPQPWTQVRFGAKVTVRDQHGEESQYRIVGVDETDVDRGLVSWCSPIGRALINAELGQRVRLRVPAGDLELDILAITYL
jgi:transcription elongation factor GreB